MIDSHPRKRAIFGKKGSNITCVTRSHPAGGAYLASLMEAKAARLERHCTGRGRRGGSTGKQFFFFQMNRKKAIGAEVRKKVSRDAHDLDALLGEIFS